MNDMHILAAVDFDDDIEALASAVAHWAKGGASKITVVGIAPQLNLSIASNKNAARIRRAQAALIDDLKQRLATLAAQLHIDAEIELLSGRVADQIIKAAVLHNVDLVVKAADRRANEPSPLFGAVEKKLIRKCPVPVWIVRPETPAPPRSLVVAVDKPEVKGETDELAASLLDNAVAFALRFGVKKVKLLHICSVVGASFLSSPRSGWSPEEVEEYVEEWRWQAQDWFDQFQAKAAQHYRQTGLEFSQRLIIGDARKELAPAAKDLDADILFIGSANRSGVPGLLIGNTAESVIDRVECSVYVVKPKGFISIISPAVEGYGA
ncbi:universal stress protein [Hyphococcus sp.]|jgi:nucleotide-binding universal stress UspA family protein|uniref:universal stress protein n=1 Tax=Hyphococcus sp. TaxID=2038636 RepID=UPI003D1038A8